MSKLEKLQSLTPLGKLASKVRSTITPLLMGASLSIGCVNPTDTDDLNHQDTTEIDPKTVDSSDLNDPEGGDLDETNNDTKDSEEEEDIIPEPEDKNEEETEPEAQPEDQEEEVVTPEDEEITEPESGEKESEETSEAPVMSDLAIDCSATAGLCASGGLSYPITFTVSDAESCEASVEVVSGGGTAGSVSDVILDGDQGSLTYITGSVPGDRRLAVNCTGKGGDIREIIEFHLY